MGFVDAIGNSFKKVAGLNQLENEGQMQKNIFARDPGYIVPVDENKNKIPDILETRHHKEFGDETPRKDKLKPFSFKKPRKEYNQSFDNKGKYVLTATYPLPPINHEKKMLERNKRLRNKDNKFF